jgi:hypothetical protein
MRRAIRNVIMSAALCAGLLGVGATPATAQDVAVTGGLDFTNQYNFRGIRQNYAGMAIWPFVDLGVPVFSGDGGLKSVNINVGSWNSIHTNQFPDDFATDEDKWYESDFYATLGFGFSKATLGLTYTAYMSPAEDLGDVDVYFKTIHELAVKLGFDDSGALGKAALKPYALVAFELGDGQADLGLSDEKGVYVELGVAPGYSGDKASVTFPVKIGLSAKDYYKFPGFEDDSKFGFFSVGGIVTVPITSNWNVHGGGELQVFGDNLKVVNRSFDDTDDKKTMGIASIGIGFSF